MAIVATASKDLRNRYLIIIVACFVFAAWFAYDGFKGWPEKNDAAVKQLVQMAKGGQGLGPDQLSVLLNWPGWSAATADQKAQISSIPVSKNVGWHSAFEIQFQQGSVFALLLATAALIAWFMKVQRRRAIADESSLSPEPGLTIPWDAITKIDNTRWKKKGIVDLEYRDAAGQICKTKLDDFLLDGLRPLLNEVQEHAKNAEFISPEGAQPGDKDDAGGGDPKEDTGEQPAEAKKD